MTALLDRIAYEPGVSSSGREVPVPIRRKRTAGGHVAFRPQFDVSGGVSVSTTVPLGTAVDSADGDRALDADMRAYVSRLWAEDWDSPEDAVYDTW